MQERIAEIVRALEAELRNNDELRRRIGIEGAADAVSESDGAPVTGIVWEDAEGRVFALTVVTE